MAKYVFGYTGWTACVYGEDGYRDNATPLNSIDEAVRRAKVLPGIEQRPACVYKLVRVKTIRRRRRKPRPLRPARMPAAGRSKCTRQVKSNTD